MDYRNEIENYISRYNKLGALLITGKWGSGKSFAISKLAKEIDDNNEYSFIILSLFGVTSVDEIEKRIKKKLLVSSSGTKVSSFLENGAKGINLIKTIVGGLKDTNAILRGIDAALNIDYLDLITIKAQNSNGQKLVLILDDFERSNCCITDLMGLINRFVEQDNIPTILIADENKIDKDRKYSEFKEKVVYRTIYLNPDSSIIISSIIESYDTCNTNYKSFLKDHIETSLTAFQESNTLNFRSFKSIVHDFERIYELCEQIEIPINILDSLYYVYSCSTYEFKSKRFIDNKKYGRIFKNLIDYGEYLTDYSNKYLEDKSEDKSEYSNIEKVTYSLFDSTYSLRYIDEWLFYGKWNQEGIISEIESRFSSVYDETYIFLHTDSFKLTDDVVSEQLPLILEKSYNGELTHEELILLLSRVIFLLDIDYPIPCDIDYKKMNEGFEKREERIKDGLITEKLGSIYIQPYKLEKLEDDGQALYSKLENYDVRLFRLNTRSYFLEWLDTPQKNFLRDNPDSLFIVSFDDELYTKFAKVFISSDSSIRRNMINTLLLVVPLKHDSNFADDANASRRNFGKLVSLIEKLISKESDHIAKHVLTESKQAIEHDLLLIC